MKLRKEDILLEFYSISRPTLYKWKREKRPVAMFIEKYLKIEEINEWLKTNRVDNLERKINDDRVSLISDIIYNQYFNFYSKLYFDDLIIYFQFLKYLNNHLKYYDSSIDKKSIIQVVSFDFYKNNPIINTDFSNLLNALDNLDQITLDYIINCFNTDFKHLAVQDNSFDGTLKMDDDILFLHHQVYFKLCKKEFPIFDGKVHNIITNIFNSIDEQNINKLLDLYKTEIEKLIVKIENDEIDLNFYNSNDDKSYMDSIDRKIESSIQNQTDILIFYDLDFLYIDYETFNELVLIPYAEELHNMRKEELLLLYLEAT